MKRRGDPASLDEIVRTLFANCCGVLGWKPKAFWKASLVEVTVAIDGWQKANGPPASIAPSAEEIADLKKRYPDGPSIRKKES